MGRDDTAGDAAVGCDDIAAACDAVAESDGDTAARGTLDRCDAALRRPEPRWAAVPQMTLPEMTQGEDLGRCLAGPGGRGLVRSGG